MYQLAFREKYVCTPYTVIQKLRQIKDKWHIYDVIVDLSRSAYCAPAWMFMKIYAYFYLTIRMYYFIQVPLPVKLGNENLNLYLTECRLVATLNLQPHP